MNNNYEKVRSSRNELEAILRIRGISKQKFGRILNIKGSTIEKYVENPYYMRYYQMQRFYTCKVFFSFNSNRISF